MSKAVFLLAGVVFFFAGCTKQSDNLKLPQGWRLPNLNEANDPWRNADQKKYITLKADLDGDGLPDEALLLARESDATPALWVFLKKDGGYPKNIDGVANGGQPPHSAQIRNAGIKVLAPASGADADALAGIEYFISGGPRTAFVWDKASGVFTRTE